MEFTKDERRQLRELAGGVYEAEAHQMLEKLDSEFKSWRDGEMLSSELLSAIHEFHQHESRELWSRYQSLREPEIVARGIALGFMAESSVPSELLARLKPLCALFAGNDER